MIVKLEQPISILLTKNILEGMPGFSKKNT